MTWTGYPPDPTTDGWHWLRQGDALEAVYWERPRWFVGAFGHVRGFRPDELLNRTHVPRIEYVGPCVMP